MTIKTSSRYWIEEIGGTFIALIAFPIFAILILAGRLIENPMRKAMMANTPPVVSTVPYRVDNHWVCKPPDNFQINNAPAITVITADKSITIGKRFVFTSCCMNLGPSVPRAFTAGSTKKARLMAAPAQNMPKPI